MEADGVSDVVPFVNPLLADDDLDSVRADDFNVDAVIVANLHHHLALDHHVDAAVVVVPRHVVVVDRLPDDGACPLNQFDFYAHGEQGSYSDTTLPLPDGVMEMIWAQNRQNEYDDYSADTTYDHNEY